MKKILLGLLLGSVSFVFGQGEIKAQCDVQNNSFQKDSSVNQISYPELKLNIMYRSNGGTIDSILCIISDKDTLDRFKENQIKAFEETFPILEIVDYGLLIRMNQMTTYENREKEYATLTRTYAELYPHLFGKYSEGFALINCSQGYNFIDRKGHLLFDCFFQNATNFSNGKAKVKYAGKWMWIDLQGNLFDL